MVLSPLSSDSSSFSPVPGCFSLGVLSVNNDNTKRYYENACANTHLQLDISWTYPGARIRV